MPLFEKLLHLIMRYPIIGIGTFSALIPIIMGSINYKFFGKSSKIMYWFCVFYIVSDVPIWITAANQQDNHALVFIRDILIVLFLAATYYPRKTKKNIYYFLISIIIAILFLKLLLINFDRSFLWIPRIILIVFAFDFYAKVLNEFKIKDILIYPYFWYSVGILIFSMNSILILLFSKFTVNNLIDNQINVTFVNFLEYMNLTLFVFITIGFWVSRKNFKNLIK